MPKTTKTRIGTHQNKSGKSNDRPDESNHIARNWIFTVPNWKDTDLMKLKIFAEESCNYMIIGKETGKTGLKHLQGFLQLKTKKRGQTVKNQSKVLKCWMGLANTVDKSIAYCSKEDPEPWTFGEPVYQEKAGGAKTKATWAQLNEDIKNGMSFEDCLSKYPSMVMQTRNAVMAECLRNAPKRNFKTCVHVYFGASGTKKTTRAVKELGGTPYIKAPSSKEWFDGYDGRSDVVLDEFRGGITLGGLLNMMDKFPSQVQVKGGMVNFAPRRMTITSNLHPDEWYKQETLETHSRAALWRRFNVVKEFKKTANGAIVEDVQPPLGLTMWNDGCICGKTMVEPKKLTLNSLGKQKAVLDLSNSSFLDDNLAQTSTSLQPPMKRKDQKDLQSMKVGGLTKQLDDLYPDEVIQKNKPKKPAEDPFEVVTISDSDDEDSSSVSDPIDSFGSDSEMSDDEEEISESLE